MARGTIGWPEYPNPTPSTLDFTTTKQPGYWFQPRWKEVWFPDAFVGTMAQLLCALEDRPSPRSAAQDNLQDDGPGRCLLPLGQGASGGGIARGAASEEVASDTNPSRERGAKTKRPISSLARRVSLDKPEHPPRLGTAPHVLRPSRTAAAEAIALADGAVADAGLSDRAPAGRADLDAGPPGAVATGRLRSGCPAQASCAGRRPGRGRKIDDQAVQTVVPVGGAYLDG